MKAKWYFSLCLAVLTLVGCSKDDEFNEQKQGTTNSLTAIMENPGSRTAVDNQGKFSWMSGDAISVWNDTEFTTFNYTSGNTFTSEDNVAITPTSYAVYPAGEHKIENGTLKVNLPTTYGDVNTEHNENTHMPMLATIDANNPTNLSFKHLGGLMCFVVKNVPAGTSCFMFQADGKKVNGALSVVDNDGEKVIQTEETNTTSDNRIFIFFKSWTGESRDMKFYVPLPVGNYNGGYTVSLSNATSSEEYETVSDWKVTSTDDGASNTINRGTLLLMPTFTYSEGSNRTLVKASSNEISLGTNEEATINVSGNNEAISVNTEDATNAVLDLNYTPTEENATSSLSISDGSADDASPEDSKATVNVNAGTATVGTLNIDAPTLTVNLENGTFTSVTAKTALQTLVIKAGVKVETLKLNGGNVIIEEGATVVSIVNAEDYSVNTYILNKGTLTNTPDPTYTNIVFVSNESELNLRTVADNGGKVTLTEDVTLTETLTIAQGKEVELDLGGKTITVDAEGTELIDFKNEGTLYIYNGNIVSVNEVISRRCINNNGTMTIGKEDGSQGVSFTQSYASKGAAINNEATMTIHNVTVNAVYHSIWNSGENASLTINGGTYTTTASDAYCVGNNLNAKLTINGGSFSGLHGAIGLVTGECSLNAGSFKCVGVTGQSDHVIYVPDGVNFTYNPEECTFVSVEGAGTDAGGQLIYYGNLLSALENVATNGGYIKLTKNLELTEALSIQANATIDLGNNTVTSNAQKVFEISADATIKNGTIVAKQRCIDTRTNVKLILSDLTLNAETYYSSYGNQQPITIGGADDGTEVSMTKVDINAGTQGYGIISFVKTTLTAENCTINGYSALYVKSGSEGSEFTFNQSTLCGNIGNNDVAGNSFSTIAIQADNVAVNVNEGSVNESGNNLYAISLGHTGNPEVSNNVVAISATTTISGNILAIDSNILEENTITIPSVYTDKIVEEGYDYESTDDDAIIRIKAASDSDQTENEG